MGFIRKQQLIMSGTWPARRGWDAALSQRDLAGGRRGPRLPARASPAGGQEERLPIQHAAPDEPCYRWHPLTNIPEELPEDEHDHLPDDWVDEEAEDGQAHAAHCVAGAGRDQPAPLPGSGRAVSLPAAVLQAPPSTRQPETAVGTGVRRQQPPPSRTWASRRSRRGRHMRPPGRGSPSGRC